MADLAYQSESFYASRILYVQECFAYTDYLTIIKGVTSGLSVNAQSIALLVAEFIRECAWK